jgi:hypothetical protein
METLSKSADESEAFPDGQKLADFPSYPWPKRFLTRHETSVSKIQNGLFLKF